MRRPTAESYNNILLMHHSVHDGHGACGSLEAMLVACSTPLAEIQEQRSTEHFHAISKRSYGYGGGETSDHDTGDDTDLVDEYTCLYLPKVKKRRLTPEQVKMLEQSFAVESKMEPDQKVQLARELNLQPRQVAVWFQNRRARWKTKQLEKDYDALKLTYQSLKADFDALLQEKEHLKEEVSKLTNRLQASLARDEIKSKTEKSPHYQLLSVVTHENKCDCISKKVVDNNESSEEKFLQEVSTSRESAMSEGDSPDAVEGQITTHFTEGPIGPHEFFKPARIYSMEANNSPPHVLKSEIDEEDVITYSSRFFLEADEGAFSWWSSSWPSAYY